MASNLPGSACEVLGIKDTGGPNNPLIG